MRGAEVFRISEGPGLKALAVPGCIQSLGQAAGKIPAAGSFRESPSGAKAQRSFRGIFGTTEVKIIHLTKGTAAVSNDA
jgi:hypothetical protein